MRKGEGTTRAEQEGKETYRSPVANSRREGERAVLPKIVVMADVLQTKRLRWVMRRTLTEEEMARVQFLAVRDRRFNESNWWRNRLGIKEVVNSYVRFCHTIAMGREPPFSPPKWSAKELQRRLLSAGQTDR